MPSSLFIMKQIYNKSSDYQEVIKTMINIDYEIISFMKNKWFLKLCIISLLLIFLLCSCNKNKVIDNIDVVNKGDNILENITNTNVEEVLTKVKDELKILSGVENIETSKLFCFDNIYYINVKRNADFYGLWRYENGDLKRILHKVEDVVHNRDDDKIIINGPHNSYIIKLGTDIDGKEKVLYECYYTDILNSDKGDFTCYINDFFSVCLVDNKSNEIILNKYIDINNEFSNEDFIIDNDRVFLPTRLQIDETGWIKNSDMAYFACYDMSNIFFVIDIEKKAVFQPNFTTGAGIEDFIDKDKGYMVSGDTSHSLDTDTYMIKQMEKQYNRFYLINLFTLERFEVAKSIKEKIEPQIENEKTISYLASSGERVPVDISNMLGKDSTHIREFKDKLYSQLSLDDNNVIFHKFNNITYALEDDGANKKLIQYTEDKKINIIADKLDDVNFSELGKYISLYNKKGDIVVLDKNGKKYFEDNVFNYIVNNETGNELGVTIWGKNNDTLYIITKNDDMLSNIFEVNMSDKSIRDFGYDIDCRYENLYVDISEGYVVYSTFPGPIFYTYDKEVNNDVLLRVKYFNGEKIEIARAKVESIHFYIIDNELKYYCIKNHDIEGTYNLAGVIPANLSQEQKDSSQELQKMEIKDIASFIPKGWEILKQGDESAIAEGDLNKDGIIDKAFIVTEKEGNNSSDYAAQRNLIIVFGNSDGSYDLSITARNAILLANEGGTFGDPFNDIAIDEGFLLLKFMGGSARWERCFRFDYRDSDWFLIGFTESNYEPVGDSMEKLQHDYNLITGNYIGNKLENGEIKTVEKNIGKNQQLKLNDFIANEYSVQP